MPERKKAGVENANTKPGIQHAIMQGQKPSLYGDNVELIQLFCQTHRAGQEVNRYQSVYQSALLKNIRIVSAPKLKPERSSYWGNRV